MRPSEALARGYFDQLLKASKAATNGAGARDVRLLVAGQPVSLRFANPKFESVMLRAMMHLQAPAVGEPAFSVYLWDTASAGQQPPSWPWDVPPGEPWFYRTATLRAAYVPETSSILVFDRNSDTAIFWTTDLSRLPIVERGSPLLRVWAWWLAEGEVQFTHAGAVANESGAALLLGSGGSGKSTTALQSLNSRLFYLADDYCLIRATPMPTVYSLYSSGKVNASERPQFPWLEGTFAGIDADKSLFQLHPAFADRLVLEKPLRLLLACRVTGAPGTRAVPLSSAEAIRISAPGTIVQLHRVIEPAAALRTMTQIAREVPAFRLELGSDRSLIPEILGDLLSG